MATTHEAAWPSCEPTFSTSMPPPNTLVLLAPAAPDAGIEYGFPVILERWFSPWSSIKKPVK
jgi:hypothetical protein